MERKILKVIIFMTVGVMLFYVVQDILTPNIVWPYFKDNTADMLNEIEKLEGSDVQVLFVGTSHSMFSIDPMRIYKNSGIITYNLSSAGQPLDITYYVLKEVFQEQSPDSVLIDASGLFIENFKNADYRYVLDSTRFNRNKLDFAKIYSEHYSDERKLGAALSAFFTVYQYHDRWNELGDSDFILFPASRNCFLKGYYMTSVSIASSVDVSYMNYLAQNNATGDGWKEEFNYGMANIVSDSSKPYVPEISQENLSWLLRIKELCEDNGAELQLIKIPSCAAPQEYSGAWTEIKSEMVKDLASDLGIRFVDLFYDVDIGIDWSTDTQDGGRHLNYHGANKVTDFLVDYLQVECGLEGQHDEKYEKDIPAYDAVCKVAELQMADDLSSYLERLSAFDDVTVFLSASDMVLNLSAENCQDLNDFGLQTEFDSPVYIDSFLAVKEASTVSYEASSNRPISNSGVLSNGSVYSITGCGWGKGMDSKIIIDGVNYALNLQGINIVVYDNASKLVIDSVVFPTWRAGDQSAVRNLSFNTKYSPLGSFDGEAYLLNYELYLMEKNARNGVGR